MSAQTTAAGRPFLKLHYDFLEEVMPILTGNEFKVALIFYRETVGWNREQVAISYGDLEVKTGLNKRTLQRVITKLLEKHIIRLCSAVGRWGMHVYALAKRFITGEDDPDTMDKTPIVQPPLSDTMDNMSTVVWTKLPQNCGQDDHTTVDRMTIEPTPGTAPEEAPDVPKETLIEIFKERNKERVEVEEKKVEEEDEERRMTQKRILLNKRILDAKDHARTARKIGKYAGWTEAQWDYEERLARKELAELDAAVRSSA